MQAIATTQGLGPFYPKIILDDFVYIKNDPHDSEDDAVIVAQKCLEELHAAAQQIIKKNGFGYE